MKRLHTSSAALSATASAVKRTNLGHGPALMWFRNDLRVHDNPALNAASEFSGTAGGLHAIFLIDHQEWHRHFLSPSKVDFILRTVDKLRERLSEFNVPLHVYKVDRHTDIPGILSTFCTEHHIHTVYFNKEYEVDEGKRDVKVVEHLKGKGIDCLTFDDQCIVQPGLLKTKTNEKPFTVFTPFKNAWIDLLRTQFKGTVSALVKQDKLSEDPIGTLPSIEDINYPNIDVTQLAVTREQWPAGEEAGLERLENFAEKTIQTYKAQRDIPSVDKTSRLSAYLSIGSVSSRACLERALLANNNHFDRGNEGAITWISELCWRDFYRHIMVAFPRVSMGRPFKPETEKLKWRDINTEASSDWKAWCEGRTGYPLVDAAMRCLIKTGWMHNRLRMVTAMFLTKDLLIHWGCGEQFFMEHLIDGDLASNNGGWQWSASTGTDSQPYFRVFNPLLQSEKFDPDGAFIKQWVPELKNVKAPHVHAPYERMDRDEFAKLAYPKPIVDHAFARERCLNAFKSLKE